MNVYQVGDLTLTVSKDTWGYYVRWDIKWDGDERLPQRWRDFEAAWTQHDGVRHYYRSLRAAQAACMAFVRQEEAE